MQVVYDNFPIYNSNGTPAAVLNGTYEASHNEGQQKGWWELRKVAEDGAISDEIAANIHVAGVTTE